MKPICPKCQREYKMERSGVWVLERWVMGDYRITQADLYQCPKCGNQIIAGFAEKSMEHYEPGFDEFVAQVRASENQIVYEVKEK